MVEESALIETLDKLRVAAERIPSEQVPNLMGELRKIEARLMQRLLQPPPAIVRQPDRLLTAEEASPRLGCSVGHLYNKGRQLPFFVKTDYGPRFSERGIEEYIRACSSRETTKVCEMGTQNVPGASKYTRKTR